VINSNGTLNYKVAVAAQLPPPDEGYTGVLDVMPNVGLPAASTGGGGVIIPD